MNQQLIMGYNITPNSIGIFISLYSGNICRCLRTGILVFEKRLRSPFPKSRFWNSLQKYWGMLIIVMDITRLNHILISFFSQPHQVLYIYR